MYKIISKITMCGYIVATLFCCISCDSKLEIQQSFPFTVEIMPVQSTIAYGETVEIRCEIKSEGQYDGTSYTIRYFQPLGNGSLRMDNGTVLKSNDSLSIRKKVFRLYYTSASTDQQKIDVYVEDNFGQVVQLSFTFTNKTVSTGTGRRIIQKTTYSV